MQFRPLSLEDKPLVNGWLGRHPPEVSELTFTNLFCWRSSRQILVSDDLGALSFLAAEGDRRFFLPPVCLCDVVSVTRGLFGHAAEQGFEPVVERAPDMLAQELGRAGFALQEDRNNFDYVYDVSNLALLEGRAYDGKRNQIRQVLQAHRCEYRPITAELVGHVLGLETRWCNLRHCGENPGLEAEQRAIAACFEDWSRLGLIGGAVFTDDGLEAFAIGEKLNPITAVVHFEKANPEIRGLYQLTNQWFCRHELLEFKFVNREQDLGIAGLRQAKESYHPHHLVKKWTVR